MLPWDPTLETGHAGIDAQHRTLFSKAADLVAAIEAGREEGEVKALLGFLGAYVAEHFADEEGLMRAAGFPGLEEHAAVHRRLERRLVEVAAAWEAHGATSALRADVRAMMSGWVTIHIGEKDREVADWLKPRAAAAR